MGNNVITFFPDIGTSTILDQLSDQYVHRFDEPWTNRSDATKTYRCYVKGILNIHTIPSYIHAAWTFDKKWNQTTGSRRLQLNWSVIYSVETRTKMSTSVTVDDTQMFGNLIFTVSKSTVQSKHNRLVILAVKKVIMHSFRYQLLPTVECVLILSTICLTSCATICIASCSLPTSIHSAFDLGKWRNKTWQVSKLYNWLDVDVSDYWDWH